MKNIAYRLEALVLAVLLLPLVLLARLVSPHHPPEIGGCPRTAPATTHGARPSSADSRTPPPVVVAACTSAPPAAGRTAPPLASLTVAELRRLAQARGLRSINGTRASKANRASLMEALA